MQIIYPCCCGLDVHAKTVVACLIKEAKKQTRTFSTMTDDLLALSDWLVREGCTHVAIESTGVYWKPVFNILEGAVVVILVNARHVKGVPGRKTDVKDSEWLADLLSHGLLKASFVPPRPIRELRELTRYRQSLVKEQASVANRIQKLIESANIKLGQVVSDVLGVSGQAILRALAAGETDVEAMVQLAKRRLKRKQPELRRALPGQLSAAQRWVLGELLTRYGELEAALERVNEQIHKEVASSADFSEAKQLLDTIPGIGEQAAETVIAEIGVAMSCFPSAGHLASWAGMCPGNNESAGKRRSGKTTKGSPYLRGALVQIAWAASHSKGTYLAAQFHRLVKRMGRKKALVALGHRILVIIFHVLSRKVGYQELGENYFDRQRLERQRQRLISQLESLGLKVAAAEIPPVAQLSQPIFS